VYGLGCFFQFYEKIGIDFDCLKLTEENCFSYGELEEKSFCATRNETIASKLA